MIKPVALLSLLAGAIAFTAASPRAERAAPTPAHATPTFAGLQAKIAYSAGMENNSKADVGVTGGAPGNSNTGPEYARGVRDK